MKEIALQKFPEIAAKLGVTKLGAPEAQAIVGLARLAIDADRSGLARELARDDLSVDTASCRRPDRSWSCAITMRLRTFSGILVTKTSAALTSLRMTDCPSGFLRSSARLRLFRPVSIQK